MLGSDSEVSIVCATQVENVLNPEGQLACLIGKLEQHNCTIQHRTGSTHGNVDNLSQLLCPSEYHELLLEGREKGVSPRCHRGVARRGPEETSTKGPCPAASGGVVKQEGAGGSFERKPCRQALLSSVGRTAIATATVDTP